MAPALHGKPVAHTALVEEYETPEAYEEQGDTRVIRDLMFGYTIQQKDASGNNVLVSAEAMRNDTVTTDQIGVLALTKGEENHSFYTDKELAALAGGGAQASAPSGDPTEMGEYELAEWLKEPLEDTGRAPTINDVLEYVDEDKDFAHRMLQAENIRTDGDPRAGLVEGLNAIIEAENQ